MDHQLLHLRAIETVSLAHFLSPGYLPFLESLQPRQEQLRLFHPSPTAKSTPGTALPDTEDPDLPVFGSLETGDGAERKGERGSVGSGEEGARSCVIS